MGRTKKITHFGIR